MWHDPAGLDPAGLGLTSWGGLDILRTMGKATILVALLSGVFVGCDLPLPGQQPSHAWTPCSDGGVNQGDLPTTAAEAAGRWAGAARCSGVTYDTVDCEIEWWSGEGPCEAGAAGCDGLYICRACPASGRFGGDHDCDHGGVVAGPGAR